jgi:predicted component of type VI protein secretion system
MLKAALAIANAVDDSAILYVDHHLVVAFREAKAAFLAASASASAAHRLKQMRESVEAAQQERFRQFLATSDPTTLLARDLHYIEPPYEPMTVTPVYEARDARLRRLVQAKLRCVTEAEAQAVEEPECKKSKVALN